MNLSLLCMLTGTPRVDEGTPARRFDAVSIVLRPARAPAPEPVVRTPRPVASPRAAPRPPVAEAAPPAAGPTISSPFPVAEAVPPRSAASAPLALDDTTLRQARSAARRGSVGAIAEAAGAALATARSPAEQQADSVQRAARPDCRSAHAGKGLFAVPFLLRDAIADDGCRW